MDEDLRRLENTDLTRWRAALRRLPADVLRDMEAKLDVQYQEVLGKIGIVRAIAPRCWCGVIADGPCAAHAKSASDYDATLGVCRRNGWLAQWDRGEAVVMDVGQKLLRLHAESGYPGKVIGKVKRNGYSYGRNEHGSWAAFDEHCLFPECTRMSAAAFCMEHFMFKPIILLQQGKGWET